MEVRTNKHAYIVGIFVVIAVAIFILTVFTLGGERKTFSSKVPVKAVFTDINGLKEGNNIWFSGVKIGTVKTIDLKGSSDVEVTLNIEEKTIPFIRKDAKVKLSSEGLLGNKIVIIYGGSVAAAPVEKNDYLSTVKENANEDMMASLQAGSKNLLAITVNLKDISKKIAAGEGTFGKLVNDPDLANTLQTTAMNLKTISVQSKKIAANIEDFSARINTEGSSINKLFADTLLFDSIKTTITQLKAASNTANEFVNHMNAFASDIKNATNQLKDSTNAAGMILNDQGLAMDIQTVVKNLESASKKLDEDLEAIQHNFLFRGYFKKKQNQ